MSKAKPRNDRGTPIRSVRISDRFWEKWRMAASLSGVSRNQFMVSVTNHAAQQIIEEAKNRRASESPSKIVDSDKTPEPPESPGLADCDLRLIVSDDPPEAVDEDPPNG